MFHSLREAGMECKHLFSLLLLFLVLKDKSIITKYLNIQEKIKSIRNALFKINFLFVLEYRPCLVEETR